MNTDFQKIREIFLATIDRPADRWGAYLDEACAGDDDLRRQVALLLDAHARGEGLLDQGGPAGSPTHVYQSPAESAGGVIGPYKLLQVIGEGGMGVVWMAEQTEPVQRKVALKIIRPGLDSKQVLARFEAERQALALMDHPNISKVFDAGATSEGRPYFVMELVKGEPITKYCDEHRLTPRQRLELFLPVCLAVQHAHQKGIIHRDIKPSNVLVAPYDGKPVPKVIDFGVAKAAGQRLTEKTLFTEFGAVVGTLEYMSPEQAELNNQDVDTRSDIYSLGVLLYELLTGTTPINRKRLKDAAFMEVLRVIREEEPQKPSTRLSTTEELPSISAQRHMEPTKLMRLVRGELDWIVMKALDKDRNRRYETANAFAMDIQRYLADEAVSACPPSAWYRFRKFARRNKGALGTALLLTLAALILLAGAFWHNIRLAAKVKEVEEQRGEARREAKRADANFGKTLEAVDKFLSQIGQEKLKHVPGMEQIRRQVLEEALQFFQGFLGEKGDKPAIRWEAARAYFRVGHIQYLLGDHEKAERAYEKAIELLNRLTTEDPAKSDFRSLLADCQTNQAILFKATGRTQESELTLRRALKINEDLARENPNDLSYQRSVARSSSDLATVLSVGRNTVEAEKYFRIALAAQEKLAADAPKNLDYRDDLARTNLNFGRLLKTTARLTDAEKAYRRAVELYETLASESKAGVGYWDELSGAHLNLGTLLEETSRHPDAEKSYRRALELSDKLVAAFPSVPDYRSLKAKSIFNLASLLEHTGQTDEAERSFRRGLELLQKLAGEFPRVPEYRRDLVGYMNNLGALFYSTKRLDDAEKMLRQALELQRALATGDSALPDDRAKLATGYYNLANLLDEINREQDAEAAYREAKDLFEKLVAESPKLIYYHHVLGAAQNNLAHFLRERGELAAARKLLESAIEHQTIALNSNPRHPVYPQFLANHYRSLTEVLLRQKEHALAAKTAAEAPRLFPTKGPEYQRAAEFIARCIPLAEKDARSPEARRRDDSEGYARQAVAWLREAAAKGYKDTEQLTKPAAFDPLRSRADFQKLVNELKEQQPKAPSKKKDPVKPPS